MSRYTSAVLKAKRVLENYACSLTPKIHVKREGDTIWIGDSKYEPFPTIQNFMHSDADIKMLMGPYGSGKSSGITAHIIQLACDMPICIDGKRRLRALIVRNTYDELKSTSLAMWNEWTEQLGITKTNRQPPITWFHKFNDEKGVVLLEVIFLALSSENALSKLDSYNVTIAYINETRSVVQNVLSRLYSRTGRYPPMRLLKTDEKLSSEVGEETKEQFWHGILADTNPPTLRHWIKKLEDRGDIKYIDAFGKERVLKFRVFHQPEAIYKNDGGIYVANPAAENIKNLPGGYDYYFNMIQNGDDYVDVYARGKYGSLRSGQVVYNNYNDAIHSTQSIEVDKKYPLIFGVDYGRTCPAILVCQYINSQLRAIKEFVGSHVYIYDLAREEVIPWMQEHGGKKEIGGRLVLNAYGRDDCSQTDDGRTQLRSLGLDVKSARTNKPEPRIFSVGYLLGKIGSNGQPSLLISQKGCPTLREGFQGEYKLEEKKNALNGETKEMPEKSHPYSDIHDGLQYVALEFANLASLNINNVDFKSPKPANMWI